MKEQGKAGDDALDMILHIDVYDGCLSGDCPHDHENECLESVSKYAKEYGPDAREQYLALLALSDASRTLRQRLAVVDAELSALRASHERMRVENAKMRELLDAGYGLVKDSKTWPGDRDEWIKDVALLDVIRKRGDGAG